MSEPRSVNDRKSAARAPLDEPSLPWVDYECRGCGYRAAVGPPLTCPMCGGRAWLAAGSRRGAPLVVSRLANTVFVLTPPTEIDQAAALALSETIADLAHDRPDVVLDLTAVERIDDGAARLIVHLSALTRAARGRLLAICPAGEHATAFTFDELETAAASVEALHRELAVALDRVLRGNES